MTIIRVAGRKKWTTIANSSIEDASLTWEARGLLVYLLSKPDNWTVNRDYLVTQAPNGQGQVRRVLTELTDAGYLHVRRFQDSDGKAKTESLLYESPTLSPDWLVTDQSETDRSGPDQSETNQSVISTEVVSTEEQKPLALSRVSEFEAEFEVFYGRWRRKRGKGQARKAWRVAVRKATPQRILDGEDAFNAQDIEPGFIPYPATWLNGERWEDEWDPPEDEFVPWLPCGEKGCDEGWIVAVQKHTEATVLSPCPCRDRR